MITFIQVDTSSYRACKKLQYLSSLADNKEIKTRVVLPYVPKYFETLSKILRNVGILV